MSNGFNLFNNASKAASPSRLFKENESRVGSSRISNPSQAQNQSASGQSNILGLKHPSLQSKGSLMLSENSSQNYFLDLLPKLQNDRTLASLETEINQLKGKAEWIRGGIEQFSLNKHSDEQFINKYKNQNHLGLTFTELGFGKALITQSKKLDLIWFAILQVMNRQLKTNKLMGVKLLRKYIKQSNIYKKLYVPEIGNDLLKPNDQFIDKFFTANPKDGIVQEKSQQFLIIMAELIGLFFKEQQACILCLTRMVMKKEFRKFFRQETGKVFIYHLWMAYCSLTTQILTKQPYQEDRNQSYVEINKLIFNKKSKNLILLAKLIYGCINEIYLGVSLIKVMQKYCQNSYTKMLVQKMDGDITKFQSSDVIQQINSQSLIKMVTELFLVMFPFEDYYFGDSRQSLDCLKNIKSQALTPIKMLCTVKESAQYLTEFEQLIQKGMWSMNSFHWRKWIGIFIKKYSNFLYKSHTAILERVISVCKKIIGQQCQKFWSESNKSVQQIKQNQPTYFYLFEIKYFLQKCIKQQKILSFSTVIPILTKLLGKQKLNYCQELLDFLGSDQIKFSIINTIIQVLHLDVRSQQERPKPLLVYKNDDRDDQSIEQQMKFLCRLVQLMNKQLQILDKQLLEGSQESTGFRIVQLLFRCVQKLSSDKTGDIKCLRYIIQAIDSVFVNQRTRKWIPIAIGVSQINNKSISKSLKAIVDVCVQPKRNNQASRQAIKLRVVLSLHLNHIVKLSDYFEQYFPTTSKKEYDQAYVRLYRSISSGIDCQIDQFLRNPCLKSVSWFYYLLLLLESDNLRAIDFDTIRLLLLKMRIKNQNSRQYCNMMTVVEMINKGRVHELIFKYLTPAIKNDVKDQGKYLFGLSPYEFEAFMGNYSSGDLTSSSSKYANKMYRISKAIRESNRDKQQLYGKLGLSLQIIETILKLKLEGNYPILKTLNLSQIIIQSLVGNKYLLYSVNFIARLEEKTEKNQSKDRIQAFLNNICKRQVKIIEHQMTTQINLIHAIMSLLDFQTRMDIDKAAHPSKTIKIGGVYYIDLSQFDESEGVNIFILQKSMESVFTDLNRQSQTIGVSSVLKIAEYLILLGYQKNVYLSILHRNYPKNWHFPERSPNLNNITQLFDVIVKIMSRLSTSSKQKEYILQFLCVCVRQSRFSQYIHSNLLKFRDPLSLVWKNFGGMEGSIVLRALFFLQSLLNKYHSSQTIRLVKGCMIDPEKGGKKLIQSYKIQFSELKAAPVSSGMYGNYLWCYKIKNLATWKGALFLYVSIVSTLISSQQFLLVTNLCQLIFRQAKVFLDKVPELPSPKPFERLLLEQSKTLPQFKEMDEIKYFSFNCKASKTLYLSAPFSIIQGYILQPWQVYYQAKQKKQDFPRQFVIECHKVNALSALYSMNQVLIQEYHITVLKIMQRGSFGFQFSSRLQDNFGKQNSTVLNYMKTRSFNGFSCQKLIGIDQKSIERCIDLCKIVIEQIWGRNDCLSDNKQMVKVRHIGIMLVEQLLRYIQKNIKDKFGQSMSRVQKLIDRLFFYIEGCNIRNSLTCKIYLFATIFKLQQRIQGKNNYQQFKKMMGLGSKMISYSLNILKSKDRSSETANSHCPFLQLMIGMLSLDQQNILKLSDSKEAIKLYLQSQSRNNYQDQVRNVFKFYISHFQTFNYQEETRFLIVKLFQISMSIDQICKSFSMINNLTKMQFQPLLCHLQKISGKVNEQNSSVSMLIAVFLSHMAASNSEEYNRPIFNVLKAGYQNVKRKINRLNQIRTFSGIIELKCLFTLFSSLSRKQNWSNFQSKQMLNQVFIITQNKGFIFDWDSVVPATPFQKQLNSKYLNIDQGDSLISKLQVYNSKYSSKSFFQMLVIMRMHQFMRVYVQFISSATKNSHLLFQLCDKTINTSVIDENVWERIKMSLMSALDFLERITSVFEESELSAMVKINKRVSTDPCYFQKIGQFFQYFQTYTDVVDLVSHMFNTLFLLYNSIESLLASWRQIDWKTKIDWNGSRKQLLIRYQKLANKFTLYTKLCDQECEYYDRMLKKNLEMVREQINLNDWSSI